VTAALEGKDTTVDWKIELIGVPVADIDRAKDFYVSIGFNADHDHRVDDTLRFVQLTPPGSMPVPMFLSSTMEHAEPGDQKSIQAVVADADAAREQLTAIGVDASEVDETPWGRFVYFGDPDGNRWSLQQMVEYTGGA
jgi:catechol 2,3-dioxygenase-like lactoylglutathione lyase family enzyme